MQIKLNKGISYLLEEIIDESGLSKSEVKRQLENDKYEVLQYGGNKFWSLKI